MYPLTVRVNEKRVVVIGGEKLQDLKLFFTQTGCGYSCDKSRIRCEFSKTCGRKENSLVSKRI